MVSKTIAVLGSNGFLGSNLLKDLDCVGITKDNYKEASYDVLINANGNSRKLLPESDPLADFDLTVRNTLKSIVDFKFDVYVYLSSCEVYCDETSEETTVTVGKVSRYGLSKYLAECVVRKYCSKWLILRLNGPIGFNMRKGPIYDIMNGDKIWMSADSEVQLIHTSFISSFVRLLLDGNITNEIVNITGSDSISLNQVMKRMGKRVVAPDLPLIRHKVDVSKASRMMAVPTSTESILRML